MVSTTFRVHHAPRRCGALRAAALAAALLFIVTPVWAGSYLNRAALLLDGARIERDLVRPRGEDRHLLLLVHRIAQARTQAARDMEVPKSMSGAHPHLLLVMENTERAYAAALDGHREKFAEHIVRARQEDKTFRAIVAKLGYTLPSAGGG
jgi:hypothetical protein